MTTIRVEVDVDKLIDISRGHAVWTNVNLLTMLEKEGIPVDGGIQLRGVKHGTLLMRNEIIRGRKHYVFEWTPGSDSVAATPFTDDDEI